MHMTGTERIGMDGSCKSCGADSAEIMEGHEVPREYGRMGRHFPGRERHEPEITTR